MSVRWPTVKRVSTEDVEVRRSTRRRRTVSARREAGRVVVLIPASMSRTEERVWVARMLKKLEAGERRRRPSDQDLLARAGELSARFLGGHARPTSIRWVSNQRSRWGSCTPADGSIRLSDRLRGMPSYVVDYVILHELAHLLVAGHNRDFWTLLRSYPKLERARGFLDGVALAQGLDIADDVDDVDDIADQEPGVEDVTA
jgi:predicted metal-dependent hydrolase